LPCKKFFWGRVPSFYPGAHRGAHSCPKPYIFSSPCMLFPPDSLIEDLPPCVRNPGPFSPRHVRGSSDRRRALAPRRLYFAVRRLSLFRAVKSSTAQLSSLVERRPFCLQVRGKSLPCLSLSAPPPPPLSLGLASRSSLLFFAVVYVFPLRPLLLRHCSVKSGQARIYYRHPPGAAFSSQSRLLVLGISLFEEPRSIFSARASLEEHFFRPSVFPPFLFYSTLWRVFLLLSACPASIFFTNTLLL